MIHYHGTPISPVDQRFLMAGKNFCVSFADARDAEWCVLNGQSVMFDSGAFSAYTRGHSVDFNSYFKWMEPWLGPVHWGVVPDVIGGEVDEQRELLSTWPFQKSFGAPVWHMNLSLDWLIELAENWPRICFGSSGRYWQVGSDLWARRADEAWNALSSRGLMPWVHMMRGLSLCGDKWPFASADSVNVARNFKNGKGQCPERMARNIDARNSPTTWRYKENAVSDLFSHEVA